MSLVLKRRLAASVAAVVVAVGGGAGTAAACHGGDGTTGLTAVRMTTMLHHGFRHHHHGYWWSSTVTNYLGITGAQLKTDLKNGQTLAQVANSIPGKSAAGLVDAVVAPWKTKLDAAVTAGKLSSANESTILSHLTVKVTAFVNGDTHWWRHR